MAGTQVGQGDDPANNPAGGPGCAHRGTAVGKLTGCCNGDPPVVLACAHPALTGFCIDSHYLVGNATVRASIGLEVQDVEVNYCGLCPHNTRKAPAMSLRERLRAESQIQRGPALSVIARQRQRVERHATPGAWVDQATRNLVFWLHPKRGVDWRWHAARLRDAWHWFRGVKIISVALSDETNELQAVMAEFPDDVHWQVFRNDASLREVVGWEPTLEVLRRTAAPESITLACHSKGITRHDTRRWTEIMYETCLDYLPLVEWRLRQYPIAGSFKKIGKCFRGSTSTWHYSGTFYWFNTGELFERRWNTIDRTWWGTESWPSLVFRVDEGGVLFRERHHQDMDLYRAEVMQAVEEEYSQWKPAHQYLRNP